MTVTDSPRRLGLLLVAGLFLAAASPLAASQLAEVALADFSDLERLQRAGFDVSYYSAGGLAEVVLMSDADRARLNATGLRYFISVENVEAFFASRLPQGRDDMGGYRTFTEIVDEMNRLHDAFPEIISEPVSVGESIGERPLWAFKVSDNPEDDEEDEPEALFTSLIHCREVITSYVLFGVIEALAEGYGNNDRLTRLVDERQTWFLPVVNPDGYAYNQQIAPNGGGMWRKNRRQNQNGSWGVDLNRNFGEHWGFDDVGSSPNGESEVYRGTEAFSEPETQSLREFVNSRRFAITFFFHSYSNLCLYPYGYDVLQAPDRSLLSALAKRMIAVNNYLPGTGWEVIYRTNGDSDDWLYGSDEHNRIMAFTIEVGSRQDFFWPPLNRVQPLVSENIEAVLTAIEYADRPARALQPPPPEIEAATITPDGRLTLHWTPPEDEANPTVSSRILARLPGDPITDDAPPDDQRWEKVNFNMSQVERHSGTHSYRAALQQPMATMTRSEEIVAPDTIWAWVNYELRQNRNHCLALEASEDGWTWEALPGLDAQDFVVNGQSIGPGVFGASDGWRQTWWRLGRFAGSMTKLRFRYYQFNVPPNPASSEFCYIDDIGPVPTFGWSRLLAEGVEGTLWEGPVEGAEEAVEYLVQAVDEDGDRSLWCLPTTAIESIPPVVLRCELGWSMVSAPVELDDPTPARLFAPWIERGYLSLVKDGFGRFFLPRMNFDQIGRWNPLSGYWVKLLHADTLVVEGDRVPPDTPLPLLRGWNMIAYLPTLTQDCEQAWEGIADRLILAKDGMGRFWAVAEGFNNLPPLTPGEGYSLKLTEADTLVYPAGDGRFVASTNDRPLPAGFRPPSPDNMSLLLALPDGIKGGWVRLFDDDGWLSGGAAVPAAGGRIGVAAWGEESAGTAGFALGEPLRAVWRDNRGVETGLRITPVEGSTAYETDGFAYFRADLDAPVVPLASALTAFPNPFNGRTELAVAIAQAADVELEFYDPAGRMIGRLQAGPMEAGTTPLSWDASDLPAGLYLCRMTARSLESLQRQHIKLLLVR